MSQPKDWLPGNLTESAFFDALSVHIPESERFVMRAMHDAYPMIRNAGVRAATDALLEEERQHSLVHDGYNEQVRARGYEFARFDEYERRLNRVFTKHTDVRTRVAICVCIEHFTAVMSVSALNSRVLEDAAADAGAADVWRWHAAEEYGHRGTAFRVYRDLRGGYLRRAFSMLFVSVFFLYIHVACLRSFLRQSGAKRNAASHAFLFGRNGIFPSLVAGWLRFFVPGFNPERARKVRLPEAAEHAAREARVFALFAV